MDKPELTIDKNIPMPPKGNPVSWVKQISQMEIGDSFLLTGDAYYLHRLQNSIRASIPRAALKIQTRTTSEGLRVWRSE